MITLLELLLAFAGGAAVSWLIMDRRRLAERITELEKLQRNGPAWAESLRLDYRAQLVSIAALVKLSARDQLDALARLSPQALREVVEEIAPHLAMKDGIK